MEFPKLVYDDFYKFLISLGIFLFIVGLGLAVSIANNLILNYQWIFILLCVLVFGSSIWIIIWAGKKWFENQKHLDKKLKAETAIAEQTVQQMVRPEKEITGYKTEDKANVALVTYKIASVLPNTISFNFLKDWKVWFLIENHERKKYKAYIKIIFISDDYKKEVKVGHYGGINEWKLNALQGVSAPGLSIPEKIKEKARQGKKIKIRILCKIKDENDKLVEEKLPVEYIYNYENNSWFYEP